jgi:hypothetical protein
MTRSLGFKQLTIENWLAPDSATALFARMSPDGQASPMQGQDWLGPLLQPCLSEAVPTQVCRLFEVARGALAYGYYFYPLFTLGAEQMSRVAETAVRLKCEAEGIVPRRDNYQSRLESLRDRGIMSVREWEQWDDLREIRNMASHPEDQTILLPAMAIGLVERIAQCINALFEPVRP